MDKVDGPPSYQGSFGRVSYSRNILPIHSHPLVSGAAAVLPRLRLRNYFVLDIIFEKYRGSTWTGSRAPILAHSRNHFRLPSESRQQCSTFHNNILYSQRHPRTGRQSLSGHWTGGSFPGSHHPPPTNCAWPNRTACNTPPGWILRRDINGVGRFVLKSSRRHSSRGCSQNVVPPPTTQPLHQTSHLLCLVIRNRRATQPSVWLLCKILVNRAVFLLIYLPLVDLMGREV